jgi:mannose-6-phosphate isomerase-like protein (cupin superfamily)
MVQLSSSSDRIIWPTHEARAAAVQEGLQVIGGQQSVSRSCHGPRPGRLRGGPDNRHRGADQWLYVVVGTGMATVNHSKVPLKAGSLVLIEAGDTHKIENTGRSLLKTVSIYVPPAYDADGEELPRGKR